ncbi:glutamine amidotransferase [Tistlia consotensis]|uniref:Imidazole glycerol phosphate synthase subunit HisH n=1 Tax=Tistlia consotensis USBA 355 TaxID=560819 RepID=A0A1Y6BL56_9PROT|nr:imidazole glycerol phosphate synthase subunit HisH [Tistlia consotensis]SMF08823.1 imidazole glycerol phosphate synthase subunit hisH [Tistlia consotensis USBA 355]SNR35110.1 glutamine amidotransferase [Tistlia consotensis]
MTCVLIDYGSGNLRSAAKALERAAAESGLSTPILVTADAEAVRQAERIVLPGVGAFADCMSGLSAVAGMTEALNEAVIGRGRPFLGICVGMQLMAERGLEHGSYPGLGWIEGEVEALPPGGPDRKIPHMGWNELAVERAHPVLAGLGDDPHVYFVHSYHLRPKRPELQLGSVDYGGRFAAVVGRDNLIGTQFHPEKSQAVGLRLLTNFLAWKP